MENFRKLAKIAALNQKIPGPVCGNPDCEELCAEAYDAALSLRLDPAETVRKTIERELHCLPADTGDGRACRFGFIPASNSLVLSAKKKKEDNEVIHIFRTGANECKKCQALEGTKISSDVWADEEKMKAKGFWKQKNGEYLPHPNCKCHWEEKIEKRCTMKRKNMQDKATRIIHEANAETQTVNVNANNGKKIPTSVVVHEGKNADKMKRQPTEVYFHVEGAPGKYGHFGGGISFSGIDDLIDKLERGNYPPHSIDHLIIIGHGGNDNSYFAEPDKEQKEREHFGDITDLQVARLRKFLKRTSIVEFRFCRAAEGKEGRKTALSLAKKLGCNVRVYGGYVAPNGGRTPWVKKRDDPEGPFFFPENKPEDFHPNDVEIQ